MSGMFIGILNMSISASFVTLIVIFIRLLIKNAPKKYAYMLWVVVFFRFIVPFTIQMPVSVVPIVSQPIQKSIVFSYFLFQQKRAGLSTLLLLGKPV